MFFHGYNYTILIFYFGDRIRPVTAKYYVKPNPVYIKKWYELISILHRNN